MVDNFKSTSSLQRRSCLFLMMATYAGWLYFLAKTSDICLKSQCSKSDEVIQIFLTVYIISFVASWSIKFVARSGMDSEEFINRHSCFMRGIKKCSIIFFVFLVIGCVYLKTGSWNAGNLNIPNPAPIGEAAFDTTQPDSKFADLLRYAVLISMIVCAAAFLVNAANMAKLLCKIGGNRNAPDQT